MGCCCTYEMVGRAEVSPVCRMSVCAVTGIRMAV